MPRQGEGLRVPTVASPHRDANGGDPTYSRRLAGMRERQALRSAAGEAGALTRSSIGVGEGGGGYYQGIREQLFRQANQQTGKHFLWRSQLANDLEASEDRRRRDIRETARMVLDAHLRGRSLDLQERGLEQRGDLTREGFALRRRGMRDDRRYRGETLDLRREENEQGIASRATDRAQRGYEFETERQDRAEERKTRKQEARKERESRERIYGARESAKRRPSDTPGVFTRGLAKAGYDVSGMTDATGGLTGTAYDFLDAADYLAGQAEYEDASPEEIARAAADYMGLQPGGGGEEAPADTTPRGGAVRSLAKLATVGPAGVAAEKVARSAVGALGGGQRSTEMDRLRNRTGAPVEGARQAPDGNWYVQNEDGGWSRVVVN